MSKAQPVPIEPDEPEWFPAPTAENPRVWRTSTHGDRLHFSAECDRLKEGHCPKPKRLKMFPNVPFCSTCGPE